jgi:hypothetical protein
MAMNSRTYKIKLDPPSSYHKGSGLMMARLSRIHNFFMAMVMISASSSLWMAKRQATSVFDGGAKDRRQFPTQVDLDFLPRAMQQGRNAIRDTRHSKKHRPRPSLVVAPPPKSSKKMVQSSSSPDYGNIDIERSSPHFERFIVTERDRKAYEAFREELLEAMDEPDEYLNEYYKDDNADQVDPELQCRPPNWFADSSSNCNIIHETVVERPVEDLSGDRVKYLRYVALLSQSDLGHRCFCCRILTHQCHFFA